jgi:hypothetical protein
MDGHLPSIGRIVHYVSYGTPEGECGKECRAAIITDIHDDEQVALTVFNPSGQFFNWRVPHEEIDETVEPKIEPGPSGRRGGTWHWPERV